MSKRWITTLSDGRLAVIQIAPGVDEQRALAKTLFELSRTGNMEAHFNPSLPGPNWPCRACEDTELPQDRYFRDAWQDTGAVVVVNMPKARAIHMNQIRKVRDAELVKLDADFQRALEKGDQLEQSRIAALKQKLRDIPTTFDLAGYATPDTLKVAWPSELPAR